MLSGWVAPRAARWWRGRWWPLQLCLDPPLLPLPLPADPLMLRWFDEDAPLWAGGAPLPSPSQQSLAPSQDGGDGGGGGRTPIGREGVV